MPAAARLSATILDLSSLGLLGDELLTRFSLVTPIAVMTASAVVVPPAQLSLMMMKSLSLASISPSIRPFSNSFLAFLTALPVVIFSPHSPPMSK